MAGRLIGAWNPALDSTGIALSGAKLHTYVAGTTTPKQTFADAGLTVPLANPIAADSAGRFPEIWSADGGTYDLQWATSADVNLKLFEDIQALGSTASGAVMRDFGADGKFNIESRGGVTYIEAGDPDPDNTGGSLTLQGWAGTEGDTLNLNFVNVEARGSNVLRAADNLSDVGSAASARANLGVDGVTTAFSGATTAIVALTPGFNAWELEILGLIPTATPTLSATFSFDGGSTYKTGATDYSYSRQYFNSASTYSFSTGAANFPITMLTVDSTASKANDFFIRINGPRATGFGTSVQCDSQYWQGSGNSDVAEIVRGQVAPGYGTPTHVKLTSSSGNIAGSFRVRGKN